MEGVSEIMSERENFSGIETIVGDDMIFKEKTSELQKEEQGKLNADNCDCEAPDQNLIDFLNLKVEDITDTDRKAYQVLEELRVEENKGEIMSGECLDEWRKKLLQVYEEGDEIERQMPKEKIVVIENKKISSRAYSVGLKGYINSKATKIFNKIDLALCKKNNYEK